MIAITTAITAYIAWLAKILGIKLALLAVVIITVTSVILATKLGVELLISSLPVPAGVPGSMITNMAGLLPDNTRSIVELYIDAKILLVIWKSKWIYIKSYLQMAQWSFI